MGGITAGERAGMTLGARFTRLQTGAKIFLILSAALLPFAIIAILATLTTTRQAGQEARSQLRVAAQESSRNLAIELVGDMTALTTAMNALAADHADAPSCARARGVFAQQTAAGAGFTISDRAGRLLCGTPPPFPRARCDRRRPAGGARGARQGRRAGDHRRRRRPARQRLFPRAISARDRQAERVRAPIMPR